MSEEYARGQRRPHASHSEAMADSSIDQQVSIGPIAEKAKQIAGGAGNRRSDSDRRSSADRRRSARGLFELRARRDKVVEDRRQLERRGTVRFRLAFWRRSENT